MCIENGEKVAYITALTEEILRFWSSIPIGLPRANISPVHRKGVEIPAGTTFLLVSSEIRTLHMHFNVNC